MADRHVLQIERLLPMGAIAGIFWRLWAQSRAGTSGVLAPGWITHLFKAITLYLGGCGAIACKHPPCDPQHSGSATPCSRTPLSIFSNVALNA